MIEKEKARILGELLDDDESFELIQKSLERWYPSTFAKNQIQTLIEQLIEEDLIKCVQEYYDESDKGYKYRLTSSIEEKEIGNSWFRITKKGRDEMKNISGEDL
jgi:hypothetical protein